LPPVTWSIWEALLVYLVGNFLLGGIVAVVVTGGRRGDEAAVVGALAADVVFLVAMVFWLRRRAPDWVARIGVLRRPIDAAIGYGVGLLLYPAVAFGVGYALAWLFELITGHPVEQPQQLSADIDLPFKALAVLILLVVAPVAEELFFRGVLYRSVRDRYGVLAGLLISSLMFGAVHYVPAPAADALYLQSAMVFTGLALGAIYEWRGNLVASIAAHAAFNTIGIIAIFSRW
jgi:CAAX protease family protein